MEEKMRDQPKDYDELPKYPDDDAGRIGCTGVIIGVLIGSMFWVGLFWWVFT
jgi:hypothetical protein